MDSPLVCPCCGNDNPSLIEAVVKAWFCNVCAHDWLAAEEPTCHCPVGDRDTTRATLSLEGAERHLKVEQRCEHCGRRIARPLVTEFHS